MPGKTAGYLKAVMPCLLIASHCIAQPLPADLPRTGWQDSLPAGHRHNVKMASAEICGNNIDDDGNGLTDNKDFACYYAASNTGCQASKIIWGCAPGGLYWGDPESGITRMVGNTDGHTLGDIAWSSDGRLYGIGGASDIFEIDPYTSHLSTVATVAGGYTPLNALVGGANQCLYMTAILGGEQFIIRVSLVTSQVAVVANISRNGLSSAGDLTFLNDFLYLSCDGGKLARIDTATGNLQVFMPVNLPTGSIYGLTTMGDGYLYLSYNDKIYQLDPATMQVRPGVYFTFTGAAGLQLYGLANYAEQCNAPACHPAVSASIVSPPPYCSGQGVVLQARGSGIAWPSAYNWMLPDGTNTSGNTLLASVTGTYKVRYHDVPDDCGYDTSFYLDIIQAPRAALGNDTIVCPGVPLQLAPINPGDITAYLWQDGSTLPYYTVTRPGTYALQASNVCGVSKDTIVVQQATIPAVYIGADTAICPGVSIRLYNYNNRQPWDKYLWSTGSTTDAIFVASGGVYALQSSNACGRGSDSVLVTIKDSCTCFPFYAQVALGADTELCSFDSLRLTNFLHQDGYRYHWQDGSTGQQFMAHGPGIYWLDVTTWCGTVRDSIIIRPKLHGCERAVYVPNAFSPGGDGHNDLLRPIIMGHLVEYEFMVYNRWGQLVYRTKDRNAGWDGRVAGQWQDPGVFVWSCTYRFNGLPAAVQKGTVLLVR